MLSYVEELTYEGKVFRVGQTAAFDTGWGHSSRQYENKPGTIYSLREGCVTIEYPDGTRFGPRPKNAYHIPANNSKAKVLLDKEW